MRGDDANRMLPHSGDEEEIAHQQELLAIHRRTLQHLRQQAALNGGLRFAPPEVQHGIEKARSEIRRLKENLRSNDVQVENWPDDQASPETERYRLPDEFTVRYDGIAGPSSPPIPDTRWALGLLTLVALIAVGALLLRRAAPPGTIQPAQLIQTNVLAAIPTRPTQTQAVAETGIPAATPTGASAALQRPASPIPSSATGTSGRLPNDLVAIDAGTITHLDMLDALGIEGTIVGWSPDGSRIAINDNRRVIVRDAQTFEVLQVIEVSNWQVAFNADWSRLAVSAQDRAEIWDVASARSLKALRGHEDNIMALAFAPNGAILATGAKDRTVRLWDIATGTELYRLTGHTDEVNSLVFTPDGRTLISASADGTVRWWDVSGGKEVRVLTGQIRSSGRAGTMEHLVISPDGRTLFAGQSDSSRNTILWRWDIASGAAQALMQFGVLELECIAPAPNGEVLAICPTSETVRFIDARSGRDLSFLETVSTSTLYKHGYIVFSPDSKVLAVNGSNQIQLWGISSPPPHDLAVLTADNAIGIKPVGAIGPGFSSVAAGHEISEHTIGGMALTADGAHLAIGLSSFPNDAGVYMYDLATGEATLAGTTEVNNGYFTSGNTMAFSADGRWLAAAGRSAIVVWEAASLKENRSFPGTWRSVAVSPDGKWIAGGTESEIRLWDSSSGQILRTLRGPGIGLVFSPDGAWLAGGSATETTLWDVSSGQKLRSLESAGLGLAFSPDGRWLAGAGEDDTNGWGVHLWDIVSGEQQHYLLLERGHNATQGGSLAFSPDGTMLAGGSAGQVALWDTATGETLRVVQAHDFPTDAVFLTFTPDGRQLVSAASDGVIRRWGVYRKL